MEGSSSAERSRWAHGRAFGAVSGGRAPQPTTRVSVSPARSTAQATAGSAAASRAREAVTLHAALARLQRHARRAYA